MYCYLLDKYIPATSNSRNYTNNTCHMATKNIFPYHHAEINLDVLNAHEQQILDTILQMDYEQLRTVNEEVQLALKLNYPCMVEHWHSVKVRTIALRISQLKRTGQLKPKASLADTLIGGMAGWLLADEFWKRQD